MCVSFTPTLDQFSSSPYLHVVHMHHSIAGIHVLFQIPLHKLKDESEGIVSVDDVVKRNDVRVFEVLQERYLSDGCARCSFFVLQSNLLQSY